MKVSGFSIIRDGVRFGYPFLQSIRSILPLVDEFVLAVGKSRDQTLELARSLDSPKLRIIETVWDESLRRGGQVMAQQTNLALDQCTGDWCFYIQGDEIIHEQDYDRISESMQRHLLHKRVEGLSFRYRHFYGSYRLINPLPYRRQIRIVRRSTAVRSVGDACGFGIDGRKLRSKPTGAEVYHYGWVREPVTMAKKQAQFTSFYWDGLQNKPAGAKLPDVETAVAHNFQTKTCIPFRGTHPEIMRDVIAAQDWPEPSYQFTPLWRNRSWWNGFMHKNFATLYRKIEKRRLERLAAVEQQQEKRAA